ncbi:MAG TPA: hypothetical protein DIT13_13425, partial [Verrucomicrobiales bacterium]|nr:hypothetical protein [Verrucomicrobiales bacterium]
MEGCGFLTPPFRLISPVRQCRPKLGQFFPCLQKVCNPGGGPPPPWYCGALGVLEKGLRSHLRGADCCAGGGA